MTTWPSSEDDLENAARVLYHQSGLQPPPPLVQGADELTRLPWVDNVACHQPSLRIRCTGRDVYRGDIWNVDVDEVNLNKKSTWTILSEDNKTVFKHGIWKGKIHPSEDVKEGPFGNVHGGFIKPGGKMYQRVKCYLIPYDGNNKLSMFCRIGHYKYDEDIERKPLTVSEWDKLFKKLTDL